MHLSEGGEEWGGERLGREATLCRLPLTPRRRAATPSLQLTFNSALCWKAHFALEKRKEKNPYETILSSCQCKRADILRAVSEICCSSLCVWTRLSEMLQDERLRFWNCASDRQTPHCWGFNSSMVKHVILKPFSAFQEQLTDMFTSIMSQLMLCPHFRSRSFHWRRSFEAKQPLKQSALYVWGLNHCLWLSLKLIRLLRKFSEQHWSFIHCVGAFTPQFSGFFHTFFGIKLLICANLTVHLSKFPAQKGIVCNSYIFNFIKCSSLELHWCLHLL